jgi:hypothetical protein
VPLAIVQPGPTSMLWVASGAPSTPVNVSWSKTTGPASAASSVADPDVGFIAKGQRVPVIGYKPQIARSGAGFVTTVLLPEGNAADSTQLVPMVEEVVLRTGVMPKILSCTASHSARDFVPHSRRDLPAVA